jgi:hypothetical protein
MKNEKSIKKLNSMPYLAALISGILAALAFPTIVAGKHLPNLSCLAWLALIP